MIIVYFFARALIALIQSLPLPLVARLGRVGGALAFRLDARHRRVTVDNLQMCFGAEKSRDEILALAKENFRRIGENYCCAIKTAAMSADELRPYVEFVDGGRLQPPRRMVIAIGHFGNFELYARFQQFSPGYQCATTYRALKQPELNQLLQSLREKSGCLYFERRTDGPLLRTAMSRPNLILGLLADQSSRGLRAPFLGHDCDTGLAPAVFALRYHCELYTGFCFRIAPAKWRLEVGDEISTHENGAARSSEDIMRDVNRSFEQAVRRDPANWFWVHRRWKTRNGEQRMEGELRSSSAAPGRILVRGTNWLGDAVMTTPALLRLREKFPESHIAILTPEKLARLWLHHPAVNESITFSPGESILSVAKKLRQKKFNAALALPNSPRSAIEMFLARIPTRIGYARPWRNFFLSRTIPPRTGGANMRKRSLAEIEGLIRERPGTENWKSGFSESAHQAHEYLHLAAAMGANPTPLPAKLFVTPEEIEGARKQFGLERMAGPFFGLNPGAEYGPAKRWPMEQFIAAAKEIQRRTNCAWILFGGPNDADCASQIQSASGSASAILNLAGKTSLRELMGLLKLCRVFLTNDTGPMHVAAALGVPVVAIFGSTSPELTAPLPANKSLLKILRSDAPCSPCFLRECPIDFRCMNGISVERVVEAVVGLAKSAT